MSKGKFFRAYSNVLEDVRKEVIAIVDNKTYSWNTAFVEIKNDTELGKKILKKLEELEFI